MELFFVMLFVIFASFGVLKPYEEPDGKPVQGKTLRERIRKQILRF